MDFKKVLVTGGTGFIGYNLFQYLRRLDVDVWVFSRRTGGDILNYDALERAVEGKDVVIHLAAQSMVDFSIEGNREEKELFIDTNVKGAMNALDACRKHGVKMIHMSTSEVYGTNKFFDQPMTEDHPILAQAGCYATSKAHADLLARMAYLTEGQDVVIARGFNQYGVHQSMEKLIPRFIALATFGEPLTIYGDGEQSRDYVWAQDTADALWRLRMVPPGTIVNIGTAQHYTVNDLADRIIAACGNKGIKVHTQQQKARPAEVRQLIGSYDLLNALTGWTPTVGIDEGIAKCVDWYTANGYIVPPKLLNHG